MAIGLFITKKISDHTQQKRTWKLDEFIMIVMESYKIFFGNTLL